MPATSPKMLPPLLCTIQGLIERGPETSRKTGPRKRHWQGSQEVNGESTKASLTRRDEKEEKKRKEPSNQVHTAAKYLESAGHQGQVNLLALGTCSESPKRNSMLNSWSEGSKVQCLDEVQ